MDKKLWQIVNVYGMNCTSIGSTLLLRCRVICTTLNVADCDSPKVSSKGSVRRVGVNCQNFGIRYLQTWLQSGIRNKAGSSRVIVFCLPFSEGSTKSNFDMILTNRLGNYAVRQGVHCISEASELLLWYNLYVKVVIRLTCRNHMTCLN